MLKGIRVIEIGQAFSGPFGAEILAFLGADVIKIERPSGDDSRYWGEPVKDGAAYNYHAVNRNKKSVVLDFTKKEDMDALFGLITGADVLLHNLRPGTAEKLGIGGAEMTRRFPHLVYAELGAFGHLGPLRTEPGYEMLTQAFSGIMSITGEIDGPPVRAAPSICDFGAGMWLAIGVLAALHKRDREGVGCIVNTSIFETAMVWIAVAAGDYLCYGREPPRAGNQHPAVAPYGLFQTADGSIILGSANDRLFKRLAKALGREDFLQEPNYANNVLRVKYRKILEGQIAEIFLHHPSSHWMTLLTEAGVPCAQVQSVSEAIDHPQTIELGIIQTAADDPGFKTVGLPLSFDRRRPDIRRSAPPLGADTKAVLGERKD